MKEICSSNICTGCRACAMKCPKHCITFVPDILGALQPKIDEKKCINCEACIKVCPNNNPVDFKIIQKVYAAWSRDPEQRSKSASGGVAAVLYSNIIRNKGYGYGVTFDTNKGAYYIELSENEQIRLVQNSKYVYSSTEDIYNTIKKRLINDHKVLFIGLPCQVAGLINFLGKTYSKLITVDIVCHGVSPFENLKQHINYIESKKGKSTSSLFFRDPAYQTSQFVFSLYAENTDKPFYKKKVHTNDTYQIAYHYALNYRENCYQCKYARKERVSDITIADFTGLGTDAPITYDKKNISSIKVSTEKGAQFIADCHDLLQLDERPLSEAYYDKQMQRPSKKNNGRQVFVDSYVRLHDFEKAVRKAMWRTIVKNNVTLFFHINSFNRILASILPAVIKKNVKQLIR